MPWSRNERRSCRPFGLVRPQGFIRPITHIKHDVRFHGCETPTGDLSINLRKILFKINLVVTIFIIAWMSFYHSSVLILFQQYLLSCINIAIYETCMKSNIFSSCESISTYFMHKSHFIIMDMLFYLAFQSFYISY